MGCFRGGDFGEQSLGDLFDGAVARVVDLPSFGRQSQNDAPFVAWIASSFDHALFFEPFERSRRGAGIDVQESGQLSGRHTGILSHAADDQPLLRRHADALIHAARELLERVIEPPEPAQEVERRAEDVFVPRGAGLARSRPFSRWAKSLDNTVSISRWCRRK